MTCVLCNAELRCAKDVDNHLRGRAHRERLSQVTTRRPLDVRYSTYNHPSFIATLFVHRGLFCDDRLMFFFGLERQRTFINCGTTPSSRRLLHQCRLGTLPCLLRVPGVGNSWRSSDCAPAISWGTRHQSFQPPKHRRFFADLQNS